MRWQSGALPAVPGHGRQIASSRGGGEQSSSLPPSLLSPPLPSLLPPRREGSRLVLWWERKRGDAVDPILAPDLSPCCSWRMLSSQGPRCLVWVCWSTSEAEERFPCSSHALKLCYFLCGLCVVSAGFHGVGVQRDDADGVLAPCPAVAPCLHAWCGQHDPEMVQKAGEGCWVWMGQLGAILKGNH